MLADHGPSSPDRPGSADQQTGPALVRVVPDSVAEPRPAYGFMKDSATLKDDVYCTGETWDAEQD